MTHSNSHRWNIPRDIQASNRGEDISKYQINTVTSAQQKFFKFFSESSGFPAKSTESTVKHGLPIPPSIGSSSVDSPSSSSLSSSSSSSSSLSSSSSSSSSLSSSSSSSSSSSASLSYVTTIQNEMFNRVFGSPIQIMQPDRDLWPFSLNFLQRIQPAQAKYVVENLELLWIASRASSTESPPDPVQHASWLRSLKMHLAPADPPSQDRAKAPPSEPSQQTGTFRPIMPQITKKSYEPSPFTGNQAFIEPPTASQESSLFGEFSGAKRPRTLQPLSGEHRSPERAEQLSYPHKQRRSANGLAEAAEAPPPLQSTFMTTDAQIFHALMVDLNVFPPEVRLSRYRSLRGQKMIDMLGMAEGAQMQVFDWTFDRLQPLVRIFLLNDMAHAQSGAFEVVIGPQSSCNCPFNARISYCEHIFYVLRHIFRAASDSPVLQQRHFLVRELVALISGANPLFRRGLYFFEPKPHVWSEFRRLALHGKMEDAQFPISVADLPSVSPEPLPDQCMICFKPLCTQLPSLQADYLRCPRCQSYVHLQCYSIWKSHHFARSHSQLVECPACDVLKKADYTPTMSLRRQDPDSSVPLTLRELDVIVPRPIRN